MGEAGQLSETQQRNLEQLRAEMEKRREAEAKLRAFEIRSRTGQGERAQAKAAGRPGGHLVTKEEAGAYEAAQRKLKEAGEEQKKAA